MEMLIVGIVAFVGVAALVGGVSLVLRDKPGSKIEDRLDMLTGSAIPTAKQKGMTKDSGVLMQPLDKVPGFLENFLARFGNIGKLFEQADTSLTVPKMAIISLVTALAGAGLGAAVGIHAALIPLAAVTMGSIPMFWVVLRRRRRLKAFGAQLPDAMEMLSRSLRAGQSLGFGFDMVAQEMSDPIGKEFGRIFEEQNLGVPMEESLRALGERIPNVDLQFFVTAVILQRQTGGDLAEILDKIGALIRQRFQIWGQVQALTGEGRLSGIVLISLPFLLFAAVYQLNPDYISVLFTDTMGKQMLAIALFLQLLGALIIKKIVNIKV
jgi:tight adherence protein B